MIGAASQTSSSFRKQVGPAVWLLMLLVQHAPADWTWEKAVYAAGGNVVSDAELAVWLEVKPRTIAAWRRKLKAAGFLDWTLKPGVGRVYVLAALADPKPESVATPSAPQILDPEKFASSLVH
jgi:hypothetical protein